jgi:hypothetical protein
LTAVQPSLLGFLGELAPVVGIISFVLLLASEMFSLSYGRIALRLNRKKLKYSGMVTAMFFLVTIMARVLNVIIS